MLRAILFDMDGTITRPHIDWKALRARIGISEGATIIGYIDGLPPAERARAHAILEATEAEAAEQSVLNPGAAELLRQLRAHPLCLGLITNNHRRAMHTVVEKFDLDFDLLLSREDAPIKPAPDLLLLALKKLQLTPAETCFVGDGRYDRMASEAAGILYIHLDHERRTPPLGPTIYSLEELWNHLEGEGLAPESKKLS